ncbi:MAG: TraB/GumN family protein [Bacteroidetes bacterium]|nr:TraB/GumN family protein [Bacteroidota bacterium]
MRPFSLLCVLIPAVAWCQAPANGLLWRISGHGLQHPSYVVGTMHSRDARAYGQAPRLLQLVQGLDAVAGELDLTAGPATSRFSMESVMLPEGQRLSDLYPKKKYDRVQKALQAGMGPMALIADRMKPFFLMAFLANSTMQADSAMVLDQYLQVKAKAMGKEVAGLETAEEQLAAVDGLPLQDQADMLYDAVRNKDGKRQMDRLLDAYAAGDLGRLAKLAAKGGMSDLMGEKLLLERNGVMAHRADSLMQGGRTFLFAVGAAHLSGSQGVLAQLREQGYGVEAVEPEPGSRTRPR